MKSKKTLKPASSKRKEMGHVLPWIPNNKNVVFIDPKCEKKHREK